MLADSITGVCGEGATSTNKGWTCSSQDDCPSSKTGLKADCICGFNS